MSDEAIRDLEKAAKNNMAANAGYPTSPNRPRSDSDPAVSVVSRDASTPKAAALAVPGGFRRHHLQQESPNPPSSALRRSIISQLENFYDPFIAGVLSQDTDLYPNLTLQERAKRLLLTPEAIRTPGKLTPRGRNYEPSERTPLNTPERKLRDKRADEAKTTTLWHALLTLLKAFVGTGILFLPNGFKSGGLLFSPLCLLVISVLTLYSMLRLLQCREFVGGTYGQIGSKAMGKWGRRMVQASIILMQSGFCCTYIIFVAQNMQDVLNYVGVPLQLSTLIILQAACYVPLSWVRYISYFSISNLVADVFILYGLAYILGTCFIQLGQEGPSDVTYFNSEDYTVFIGTSIFTFEGIGLVIPTQTSLNKERQEKFPSLLSYTVVGLLIFYSGFAGVNYITFGDSIQPIVTSSLPRNGWAISVQFGYSIAQLLSYPLFLFPAVKIIEDMLGFPSQKSGKKIVKNCFRALAVLITVIVAYYGQDRLDLFVSIVGAFCCVPLSFIYPPLFYLKLAPTLSWKDKIIDGTVIFIGILTFVYVTADNARQWAGNGQ